MKDVTTIELTWIEERIERWIRFGKIVENRVVDRRRRIVGFAPDSIFAFVRWASNEYGTIVSRIDILRTVATDEPYSTVPFVQPGGEILLRLAGWSKVERVLRQIDAVEQLDIKPEEAAPEHWRHVHNRLTAGDQPRSYTRPMQAAWILRKRAGA
jgi:hypothetical protein